MRQKRVVETSAKIEKLRKRIDRTDALILKLFKTRLELATAIAEEKKLHHLPLYQKGRWKKVLKDRRIIARNLGLDRIFIQRFMDLIHEESLRLQARVKNKKILKRTRP